MILRDLLLSPARRNLVHNTTQEYKLHSAIAATCQQLRQESYALLYDENRILLVIDFDRPHNGSLSSTLRVKVMRPLQPLLSSNLATSIIRVELEVEQFVMRFTKLGVLICADACPEHVSHLWSILPRLQPMFQHKQLKIMIWNFDRRSISTYEGWAKPLSTLHCAGLRLVCNPQKLASNVEVIVNGGNPKVNLQRPIDRLLPLLRRFGRGYMTENLRVLTEARDAFNVEKFTSTRSKILKDYKLLVEQEIRGVTATDADFYTG